PSGPDGFGVAWTAQVGAIASARPVPKAVNPATSNTATTDRCTNNPLMSRLPVAPMLDRIVPAPPEWLLVDGSSLIFRAFFGVPKSVRAPDDRLVNGVRGSLERLTRLIYDRRPERIAVADDADWRPAWRVELIPEYKAHRVAEPVPPELIPQLPMFREL